MDPNRISTRFSFYDVEASGLMRGSFPVNIGWSLDGHHHAVLIKPHEGWKEERWDPVAQSIHGMNLPYLRRHGKDVRQVARILNTALAGKTVFCDSADRDAEWTDMVFSAAGVKRGFAIASVGPLLGQLGVTSNEAYESFDESRVTHPPDGVAILGVRHLEAVFDRLQKQGVIRP